MEYYQRYMEGMEYCEFKAGDVVLIKGYHAGGRGAAGTIAAIFNTYKTYDCIEYEIVVEGDDRKDTLIVDEEDLILATPKNVIEFDDDAVYGKPAFQLGDVVSNEDGIYVVSDILNVINKEDARYMYELSSIGSGSDAVTCERTGLEYLYHDNAWDDYFSDIAQNGLPKWEGELYKLKWERWLYGYRSEEVREEAYRRNTLPADSMEHILEEYSIDGRFSAVFASQRNAREIKKALNIKDRTEWDKFKEAWRDKIDDRNMRDKPNYENDVNGRRRSSFTRQEILVASEIDRLDSTFGFHREHYPLEMTNRQIMQSVREAYCNAKRIGRRKIRTDECGCVKGSALYEGVAKNGLVIRFWYNLDQEEIETAYPVRMDNNTKKH